MTKGVSKMEELTVKVIDKLGLNPDKILRKPIRGCSGFTVKQLIHSILVHATLEKASASLGYSTTLSMKKALSEHITPFFEHRRKEYGLGGSVKGVTKSWKHEFLYFIGSKECFSCNKIKLLTEFGTNSGKGLGYRSECGNCHTYNTKLQKVDIRNRTPKWANLDYIKEFYSNCPKGMHVDHKIPLRGELVSGLHTIDNLQYLTPEENLVKNNKFEII